MLLTKTIPAALAACCSAAAMAQAPATSTQPAKWEPHVDFELKPGNKRSLGESDFFVPLTQDTRSLVFLNLRGRLDNHSDREGNFGLGLRRMVENGWNLGGYGYFDRRRTESGNHFNQITLGGEALGPSWEFRANAYVPQGSRVRQVGATTTGGGITTASLSGASIQMVTSAATATTREERALKGYDAEVGWRAPVFALESPKQLRLYLGGYRFSDSTVKVSGSRARVEFQVADLNGLWRGGQLTLGAEWQHDAARGRQSFVSMRLRIPLGGGKVPEQSLSAQERRMTARVMRDVDIVTQARSNTVVTAPEVVETTTTLANGQTLTVLDSGSITGAALPGAVAAAGANSTVLLSGTFNTSAITTLQSGQTLLGATTLTVRSPSGRTATLTTPMATITGAVAGNNPSVAMANNATLSGMRVSNVATGGGTPNPFAVRASGVTGATISNNVLLGTGDGGGGTAQALLITGASSNITVRDNTLTAVGTVGITVGLNVVNSTGILIIGNTMSATSNIAPNSRAIVVNNGSFATGSTGNTIATGICSVAAAGTGSIGLTNGGTCP